MNQIVHEPRRGAVATPRRDGPILSVSIVILLTVGAALLAADLEQRPAAAKSAVQPSPTLTVTSAAPKRVVWPMSLAASGSIAPWQEASIGTQIGGYQLVEVRANVGDHVRKGQLLARLNPALLLAEEAQLKASDEQARTNLQNGLRLKDSGAISAQNILQLKTEAKTADAQLAAKRLQLRYTQVRAPDGGAISARTATLGEVASAGQELFRLILQNRLEWRGELTASQLTHIARGQLVELQLPDGTTANARVRQTAPSLDLQSRLAIVYADILPGSSARAGMYADGEVVLGQSSALVVPAECVVIRDGRSYVLKLADTGATPHVLLRSVIIGRRQGNDVEILGGLRETDRVVVAGAGFLNDGDVVRLAKPGDGRRQGATT